MDLCNRSSADITTVRLENSGDDAAKDGRLSVDAVDDLVLLSIP